MEKSEKTKIKVSKQMDSEKVESKKRLIKRINCIKSQICDKIAYVTVSLFIFILTREPLPSFLQFSEACTMLFIAMATLYSSLWTSSSYNRQHHHHDHTIIIITITNTIIMIKGRHHRHYDKPNLHRYFDRLDPAPPSGRRT